VTPFIDPFIEIYPAGTDLARAWRGPLHRPGYDRNFPDFSIDIQALENTAAIDNDRATISILYGDGNWPGMKSELLFNDVYF